MSAPLEFRPLADVEMRSIEWLDPPLFQRAAFQLVVGRKGAGKGTYLAGLAARASRGQLLDKPVNVLIVATEDSDEIDVKPRVVAAGGDPDRIYTLVGSLRLPEDVAALRAAAVEIGDVGVIILDPVASHIRGDTHTEADVRRAIDPLNGLANDLDCLILGVRHLSEKGSPNGALASILGSSAFVQVPRAVLAVAPDDEEELLFHIGVIAGNRSARGAGRTFRIELVNVAGLTEPVTHAVEAGVSNKSIDDLLGAGADTKRKAPKRDGSRDLILRELADEPKSIDHLKAVCAAEIGASGETVWRAANALKVEGLVDRRPSGPATPWLWYLTSSQSQDFVTKSEADHEVSPNLTSQCHPPTQDDGEVTDFVTKSDPDFLTSSSNGTPRAHDEVNFDEQVRQAILKAGGEA